MQATLDGFGLKPFTRALTCLSKYGDDLSICATPEFLSISATNSSLSAYCRFKYSKQFFARFNVGASRRNNGDDDQVEEVTTVTGQLLTKSLLSILKHRTVEKTVDRCELSIMDGPLPSEEEQDDDRDTLESMLIVRLHCKHGIIKTHRLLLLTPTSLMTPGVPDFAHESRLTIGPKAIKAIVEHFPPARGPKSDPQLIWKFGEAEVNVKSFDCSIDSKGQAQLSTEMTISANEFDVYNIHSPPITIAFHLKEFNATVAFAEAMSLPLDLRFTDPTAPLLIDVESDGSEILFVISTSLIHGTDVAAAAAPQNRPVSAVKRRHEDQDPTPKPNVRVQRPMKAVQRADAAAMVREMSSVRESVPPSQSQEFGWMLPPSSMPRPHTQRDREPLFLPTSTQSSLANEEALRESGLGLEKMGPEELRELLEGDGEEVGPALQGQVDDVEIAHYYEEILPLPEDGHPYDATDSFELVEEPEMMLTQSANVESRSKAFRPLFED